MSWLGDIAFPYWAKHGQGLRQGSFVERLDPDGRPDFQAVRRVRVQARQTYAFAEAAFAGWADVAELALAGGQVLMQSCVDPDRPGRFYKGVSLEGQVTDASSDLYEQACAILALTSLYRLSRDSRWLDHALDAARYVQTELAHPAGGYKEGEPDRTPRRQNPHMHMLEAYLALYEASGDPVGLAGADEMVQLLERVFFDRDTQVLREYFADDWGRWDGPGGRLVEPGHEMEWVCLLQSWTELSGRRIPDIAEALYRHAAGPGYNPATGLVYDALDIDGTVVSAGSRLWPQTEFIKAEFVRARHHGRDFDVPITTLNRVFGTYFINAERGVWFDSVDARGNPVRGAMPASAMYHLTSMAVEAQRALVQRGHN